MQSDPIKAALEVATRAVCCCEGECFATRAGPCERTINDHHLTAAAIAAFLEALPKYDNEGDAIPYDVELLAAAIRRAGGAAPP